MTDTVGFQTSHIVETDFKSTIRKDEDSYKDDNIKKSDEFLLTEDFDSQVETEDESDEVL